MGTEKLGETLRKEISPKDLLKQHKVRNPNSPGDPYVLTDKQRARIAEEIIHTTRISKDKKTAAEPKSAD